MMHLQKTSLQEPQKSCRNLWSSAPDVFVLHQPGAAERLRPLTSTRFLSHLQAWERLDQFTLWPFTASLLLGIWAGRQTGGFGPDHSCGSILEQEQWEPSPAPGLSPRLLWAEFRAAVLTALLIAHLWWLCRTDYCGLVSPTHRVFSLSVSFFLTSDFIFIFIT